MATVQLNLKAKDKASKEIKSVTAALISAQLAVAAMKMGWQKLNEIGNKSLELFKEQEYAENALEAVTGNSAQGFKNFASELQDMTIIGDEATIQLMTLGKNMQVANGDLKEVTKGAVGLSEAFKIDLNTAMKMSTAANQGQYSMLARYLPALKNATTEAEKQAIVQAAMAKGYKQATDKAQTFSGRLQQLENVQGDNLEAFGKIISVIGKDYVEACLEGAKAVNNFLNDTDRIASIGATFEVLKEAGKDIGKEIFSEVKTSVNEIMDSFEELTEGMEGNFNAFMLVSGAVKVLSIALSIVTKTIQTVIQHGIDTINVYKNVGQALFAIFEALRDPTKWAEAKEALDGVKDSFGNLFENVVDNVSDMISNTVEDFKTFPDDVKKSTDRYGEMWEKKNKQIKDDFAKTNGEIEDDENRSLENRNKNYLKYMDEIAKYYMDDYKNAKYELSKKVAAYKEAGIDIETINKYSAEKTKEIEKEKNQKIMDEIKKHFDAYKEITQNALSLMQGFFSEYYSSQLSSLSENTESYLIGIDERTQAELEREGVAEETRQEKLKTEVAELQKKLNNETDVKERANIEDEISEKNKEIKRIIILKKAEQEKIKLKKSAKEDEDKIKKQQFESNKAFALVNIAINAAASIMGWWASFSGMGIPGIALAAVQTAATTIMAGVQAGAVASQTYHGEQAGVIGNGSVSGDNAFLFANKGEALIRNTDYMSLVWLANLAKQMMNGNGVGQPINNSYESREGRPVVIELYNDVYVPDNNAPDPEKYEIYRERKRFEYKEQF